MGEICEGECFERRRLAAGLDREASERRRGIVSVALDAAEAAARSVGGGDGEFPDARPDLAQRACSPA
jgi:hypothetical protein